MSQTLFQKGKEYYQHIAKMPSGLRVLFIAITVGAVGILGIWYYEMQIHFGFKIAVGATLMLYLLLPILFYFSVSVQRHLVFLPWARWPHHVNFSAPETEGLLGARNFYLESDPGITIGVWHILPKSLVQGSTGRNATYFEEALTNGAHPVVLYMHGNSASRAAEHRKELYLLLQDLDCHVLCLDYRGYADSSQVPPSETGVVSDGRALYSYTRNIIGRSNSRRMFVWGHSLGTGVSTRLVAELCASGDKPAALILESPFTSLGEEVKNHMLSTMYRHMPYFDQIFVQTLKKNDISFQSDLHIQRIDIPICIFHAIDDPVIPFHLGVKLFRTAQRARERERNPSSPAPIYFKGFGEGYAHKYICRAPELPNIIHEFLQCTKLDRWPCPGFDNNVDID